MTKSAGVMAAVMLDVSTMVAAAGVVKVKFTTADGLFITGSSKTTGNGSQFTVCTFFDAGTGAFLGETQEPDIAFDNETDLAGHCDALAPR